MGGGTVQSSFECVASGPSGCRCERSSWCAAHKAICSESVELAHVVLLYFRGKTVQKNKQTNETQPSPDTFSISFLSVQITDMTKDMTDSSRLMTSLCSATMPPRAITTAITTAGASRLSFTVGDGLSCAPSELICVSFCSTEASARRLGSHPHLGKPRQVSPIFVWMSWVTWLVG